MEERRVVFESADLLGSLLHQTLRETIVPIVPIWREVKRHYHAQPVFIRAIQGKLVEVILFVAFVVVPASNMVDPCLAQDAKVPFIAGSSLFRSQVSVDGVVPHADEKLRVPVDQVAIRPVTHSHYRGGVRREIPRDDGIEEL